MEGFNSWIRNLISTGNLCGGYSDKVERAKSRLSLFEIACDANGISYLCEMDSKGFPLPYEIILRDFKSYINGRCKPVFKNDKGNGYTSAIYCCYSDDSFVNVDTTLSCFLGCKLELNIMENDFVKIYADKNCELKINCPKNAACIVEYWKGAKVEIDGNYDKVELIEN